MANKFEQESVKSLIKAATGNHEVYELLRIIAVSKALGVDPFDKSVDKHNANFMYHALAAFDAVSKDGES